MLVAFFPKQLVDALFHPIKNIGFILNIMNRSQLAKIHSFLHSTSHKGNDRLISSSFAQIMAQNIYKEFKNA